MRESHAEGEREVERDLTDQEAHDLLGRLSAPGHLGHPPAREVLLALVSAKPDRMGAVLQLSRRPLAVLALAALALLVVGAVQAWHSWNQQRQHSQPATAAALSELGESPAQQDSGLNGLIAPETAWASVDGCIIEYEQIDFGRRNPEYMEDETRQVEFFAAVEAFAAKYSKRAQPVSGRPIAYIDYGSSGDYGWWRPNQYRIVMLSGDSALRDELIGELNKLPALWGPRIYSQQLYFSEKYPGICTPERRIIVDGREFRLPMDIDAYALQDLIGEFELDPGTISFRAFWLPGEHFYTTTMDNPFGVGQISRVELAGNGDLIITTLVDTVDFPVPDELRSNWWHKGERSINRIVVNKAREDVDASFDPIQAIKQEIAGKVSPPAVEPKSYPPIYNYYFVVVPESLWNGDLDATFSAADIAASQATYRAAKAITEKYVAEHPALAEFRPKHPIRLAPMRIGDGLIPVMWASMTTGDAMLADGYREAVVSAAGISNWYLDVIPPEEFNK